MKLLLKYFKNIKWQITSGFALKITAAFSELMIPWLLAYIIDKIIPLVQENNGEIYRVYLFGGVMIAATFVLLMGNVWGNRVAAFVASSTIERLRADLYKRISYLSSEGIDHFSIPSLIFRVTSDTYIVQRTIGMVMRLGLRAPILLFGCIALSLTLDPVLALVIVALIPLIFYFSVKISRKGTRLFKKVQEASDGMIRVLRENVTGVRIIRALSKTAYEKERFEKINEEVTVKDKDAAYNMARVNPIISLLLNTGFVLVIIVGALRVHYGMGKVGNIIAFMTYFTILLNVIRAITRMFTVISKASASISRIDEVMKYRDTIVYTEENGEKENDSYHSDDEIRFKNVSFSYPSTSFKLENISFTLKKGDSLGIIGSTGSGKTTIISLLMRFYDADQGKITLNGKDIKDMTPHELRSRFGAVFQNDTLFKDTIKGNISLGREISLEEIERASTLADADEFINAAGGLDAEVAIRGANFSGGQKQRMLIARALAGNPRILLLDDSSSALDYRTDSLIRKNLASERKNQTTIVVAQRVSSVMGLDKILVLDDGKALGYGTHEELMKECAMYLQTYEFQMGNAEA